MSRFLKDRIKFEEGICQIPALLIIILTLAAFVGTGYFAYLPLQAESIALWLSCFGLILYSLMEEKHDAIVLNGALMALYMAFMTSMDLKVLS